MAWQDLNIDALNEMEARINKEGSRVISVNERYARIMPIIAELTEQYPLLMEHIHEGAKGAYEAVIKHLGPKEEKFAMFVALATVTWLLMQYAGLRAANEQITVASSVVAEAERVAREVHDA